MDFERCAEVALAGETCHLGDFSDAETSIFHKRFCLLYTDVCDIFLGTCTGDGFHLVVKRSPAHAEFAT